jgi:type I restriction enzyme S subunit
MKAGWQTKRLGDLCSTGSGGTPLKARKEYYEGGTIPWLLSGEVSQGEVWAATNFITEKGLESSAAKVFPRDTVLVAMYGATAGQVGILRFEAATNQAVCGILPCGHFVPEFLFYIMLSRKDELVAQAAGNAQPNISQIKIRNTEIPVPPLPEQQRIVGILDEAFEAIATAKANAESNLENARALFESHLNAVFTRRGEGWAEKPLRVLSRVNYGYTQSASNEQVGPRFLRITDIQDNRVDWPSVPYCPIDPNDFPKYRLADGDIVFARTGATTGKSYLVTDPPEAVFASYLIRVQLAAAELLPQFLNLFFQTHSYWESIRTGVAGAAQGGFNATKLGELVVPFPKLHEEQERIVAEVGAVSMETQRLASIYEQKLAALDELKKSLLHQAFTGAL